MKHFLIALTCLAALPGSYLAQASQNDKNVQLRVATGTSCQEHAPIKGGKIVGTPESNSKFKNLRLGMSKYVVEKQIGTPDDIEYYTTGKAFVPFYHGSDSMRYSAYYKKSGILVYSGRGNDKLIEIHHNANESGDRSLRR